MRPDKHITLALQVVLISVLTSGCRPPTELISQPALASQPTSGLVPFSPSDGFLPGVPYPQEILTLLDSDRIQLTCTPEYFSWSGSDHEFVDLANDARYPMEDARLLTALQSAKTLHPGGVIVSVSLCSGADGTSLVFYRVGPCGGGCAGIPTVAELRDDDSLSIVSRIEPDGDGAYFGCLPIAFTRQGLLYLSCRGEGTAILRRVDTASGNLDVLLQCTLAPEGPSCTPK
ncbi:MAG TPA: hypothetical protein VLL77_01380 [Anaerolineales bacterium]|nr:hypothetical protein [Anaerolineales bacterium]